MPYSDGERLRQLLGEVVPSGGSEDDTLFTGEDIEDFLDQGDGDLDKAAYYGWRAKWAQLVNLVDTQQGQARENMSQMAANAEKMTDHYGKVTGLVVAGRSGRTRIGNIVRR